MRHAILVRKAEPKDAQDIVFVIRDAFGRYMQTLGTGIPPDALKETAEDVKKDILEKEVFVAFLQDQLVGTIRVEIRDGNKGYISRFGVLEIHNNAGIGKVLIAEVDEFLMSRNIERVELHTNINNTPLMGFYHKRGFTVESTAEYKGYTRALLVKKYV